MKDKSGAALALTEDHLNDTLSNLMALLTAGIASNMKKVWWVDSVGGALISLYIIGRWVVVAKEHVDKLVGKGADESFVEQLTEIAHNHHKMLLTDEIRAYFFGQKYFVELEAILPANMSVQDSHDIGVALQHKIEVSLFFLPFFLSFFLLLLPAGLFHLNSNLMYPFYSPPYPAGLGRRGESFCAH